MNATLTPTEEIKHKIGLKTILELYYVYAVRITSIIIDYYRKRDCVV